jgi:hypothetical protein
MYQNQYSFWGFEWGEFEYFRFLWLPILVLGVKKPER